MKLSNLFWSLFGIMALSACSEKEMPEVNGPDNEEGGRFLAVEIMNPATTRAEGEQSEDSNYEKGYDNENQVNSLMFFFFDSNGNPVKVDVERSVNFVKGEIDNTSEAEMPNIEKKLTATVVLNTKKGENINVNAMVAVANYNGFIDFGKQPLSLSELCQMIKDYSAIQKDGAPNFLMTSSSYANETGQINVATIEQKNLCKSEEAAKAQPVEVYIERVVAKVRLTTKWNSGKVTTTKQNVTCTVGEGDALKTYSGVAVQLKDAKDTPITIKEGENTKSVYALFTGWNVTGTADKFYLFKKINSTTAWSNWEWIWNNPTFYRSYWAVNPEGLKLNYINYNNISKSIWNGENDSKSTADVAYCLENAADNDDGTKKSYNPATEKSNRTQAIIAAILVTINDETNVATPIDLAKWGGQNYTKAGVIDAMLSNVSTRIYTKETTETENKYIPISSQYVKLVPAEDTNIGKADDDTEVSSRYLCYLQLDDEATEDVKFYPSASDDAETMDHDAVNNLLKEIPGAKVWNNGMTYYYTDIRHLDTTEPEEGKPTKGYYGVVRNHIYDINITSVVGLGTPVYDPTEVIVPQQPNEDETYIAARINILSWRVVSNDYELEW